MASRLQGPENIQQNMGCARPKKLTEEQRIMRLLANRRKCQAQRERNRLKMEPLGQGSKGEETARLKG